MSGYIPLAEIMSRRGSPERTVCRRASDPIPLKQLQSDVAHNSVRLKQCVEPGAGVLLTCSDSYWFVAGLWSALYAGARVILPPNVQPGTIDEFHRRAAVTVQDAGAHNVPNRFVCEPGSQVGHLEPLDAADCLLEFFTSGSSGEPKCVAKTLKQLEVEVRDLDEQWGRDVGDGLVLTTVSHQHLYGLTFGLLWPIASGRPFDVEIHRIWETLIKRLEVGSVIVSSPAHLSRMPDRLADQVSQEPQTVLSAGAPLPWSSAQSCFENFGSWPLEIYGSTETGGVAYRLRSSEDPAWTPFRGVEVRPGAEGVLAIRSSYLRDPSWHDLDDKVEFETDRTFRLKGRTDRVAKVEGTRVSLTDLEARIIALADFSDAAAVVIDGPSPTIGVAGALSDVGRRRLAELGPFRFGRRTNANLRQHFEPASLPRRWRYIDRIPTNEQGKRVTSTISKLFEMKPTKKLTTPDVKGIRRSDEGIEIDLFIPGEIMYFEGHFPDLPVLPGIVQLDWAVIEARRHFGLSAPVTNVQNLKFRKLLRPNTDVTLTLRHRAEDDRFIFEYRDGETVYSSGRFVFAAT